MRDIFVELFDRKPPDPIAAARRAVRPQLPRRLYKTVRVEERGEGFGILLDGRPARTPRQRLLAAPACALADAIAAEWEAQTDHVDPARMPLTRLANTILDGVAAA